ncbi:hypothetical protein [Paenibacillus sp. NFR01]|uniref:hypothetical protein n=1 Tax=Paenibacillus sp. NFR01 TaxID=1566279 RepID=UPI0008D752C0|nr:hypothetical protein [Paenibacillus sp. NFR01]SEU32859.1 hypothetical protein SAMN03159358_0164 [Paenibacillus sp. NFR01]
MEEKSSIQEVFELMGLGSNEERKKYTFEALHQNPTDSWELKLTTTGNTCSIREGAGVNAKLENNFK